MASKQENKLILQALQTINKQYGKAYRRMLVNIPDLLDEWYKFNDGYNKVQEYINFELSQINEFTQLAVYSSFYESAYKDAVRAAKINYKIGYNFSQVDTKAIKALTSQDNWFTSKYQTLTDQQQTLKKMKELWQSGESIDKAVKELDDIFRKSGKRISAYTKVTLVTNNTRIRTTADLNTYAQNGIENYKFNALIDNVTTDQCRSLDGKSYSVKKALEFQTKIDNDMNKIINDGEAKGWPDWKIYNKGIEYLQKNDAFASERTGERPWQTKIIRRTNDPLKQGKATVKTYKNLDSVPGNKFPRPPLHQGCRSSIDPEF